MANRPISRLKIDSTLQAKLKKANIQTAGELYVKSDLELVNLLDITQSEVSQLLLLVSQHVAPKPKTALQLLKDTGSFFLTLGPVPLKLNNGITELVGPASAGKSQACMMLSVMATMPTSMGGLNGSVCYIDTESAFSPSRIVEIAQNRFPGLFSTETAVTDLLRKIDVIKENDSQKLLELIKAMEESIIERSVKLIILDSIASPVRIQFASSMIQRQELLGQVASYLKTISETFHIPVVITNQVTTKKRKQGEDSFVTAALGVSWAHAVNTRMVLEQGSSENTRLIRVVKSPMYPPHAFEFQVTNAGLDVSSVSKTCN
eukprot:TRINITY_DN12093_c0_g1_i1.p1 TRINITY_DN12093_c0_g1~~TRINITY_DN12093_c0_g1_i1.p1  ORF type:complete len:319 (+),score=25.78 TRINITY_DN12093_c0_g1_i1:71-1027(+)